MKNLHGMDWEFEKSIIFDGEKFKCGELVEITRKNKYEGDYYVEDTNVGRIMDIEYTHGTWCRIILDIGNNYCGNQMSISLWDVVKINRVNQGI